MLKQLYISILCMPLIAAIYEGNVLPKFSASKEQLAMTVIPIEVKTAFLFDSISIQNQLLHRDLQNVLKNVLATREGKVAAIADTFSSVHTNWVWRVREGELPKNIVGQSRLDGDAVITIFDYNKLRHATDLFVASNILHEMMHAYLTLYYRCDPLAARREDTKIQTAWQRRRAFNYNDVQHEEIEKRFRADIAIALKAYSKLVHLDVDNTIFSDLAWGGLEFRNNDNLTQEDKVRIHDRLLAELLNAEVGDERPAGVALISRR
jgi:hypothetical protein